MKRIGEFFDIKEGENKQKYIETSLDGIALLRLGNVNKGTAFTEEERISLHLDGLLPTEVNTLEMQVQRAYRRYSAASSNISKYQYLRSLQERHEVLFFALLEQHIAEMLPIIYTPTVGEAVQQFSDLYQRPCGLSLSVKNIGRAKEVVKNYPLYDIRMIVATDSSAILGIGDQGYGGLAISIGKLALYTAAGGINPIHSMPVTLDVGTDRPDLIENPLYLGVHQKRLRGEAYAEFVDQFVEAVKQQFPNAIIQWEDLAKEAAFQVLECYRHKLPSFNDDIQGTGAVTLAGVLNACRIRGDRLRDQTLIIHGAGAGGVGVAWALFQGLLHEGLTPEQARQRLFVLDSKGLLTADRSMEGYKQPYAQLTSNLATWTCAGPIPSLLETIANAKATVLIGLSGQPGCFDEAAIKAMAANSDRPIIFPLSNPTTSCEAIPADVFTWTAGRAIVATGSPFAPVAYHGKSIAIGQGNNAFIFPGLGFGASLCRAREITDAMILAAAYALVDYVAEKHPGAVYPPVDEMQLVSTKVAARVIQQAVRDGVATETMVGDLSNLESYVKSQVWKPVYLPVVAAKQPPARRD